MIDTTELEGIVPRVVIDELQMAILSHVHEDNTEIQTKRWRFQGPCKAVQTIEQNGKFLEMRFNHQGEGDPVWENYLVLRVHLSQFKTFDNFLAWAEQFLPKDTWIWIFNSFMIKRMDLAIDVPYKAETIARSINKAGVRIIDRFKGKQKTKKFSKRNRDDEYGFNPEDVKPGFTHYWGCRPVVMLCYQREIELLDCDGNIKHILGARIEVRYMGVSVIPVKSFFAIQDYLNFNPFSKVTINGMVHAQMYPAKPSVQRIINGFLAGVAEIGFSQARKEYSIDNTFKKKIGPYFGTVELMDLKGMYDQSMLNFFGNTPYVAIDEGSVKIKRSDKDTDSLFFDVFGTVNFEDEDHPPTEHQ